MNIIVDLEEDIRRRCMSKKLEAVWVRNREEEETEEEEEEEMIMQKIDEITAAEKKEEEAPFEDVLANQRHRFTAKDEFVCLLYNDILSNFVTEWNGRFLRKKVFPSKTTEKLDDEAKEEDRDGETYEEGDDKELRFENTVEFSKEEVTGSTDRIKNSSSWRLALKDEFVDVTFINGNSYSGRVSRKMMEGRGTYVWWNGTRYKGDFEENEIKGTGILEWTNDCWYEGDFVDGYRQGNGMLVDRDYQRLYIGEWQKGLRHGKGYCRYPEGDSYEGDWIMDKRDGTGYRIYPSGARYYGKWKNNFRHGIGTMAWTNGDVYRGDWECGEMHGYGEYTWHGFLNKTLSWPKEAYYAGNWHYGMRHGAGLLKLNSIGGAKYYGHWKFNKKHGYGIIIGNNGESIDGKPLFDEGILVSSREQNLIVNNVKKEESIDAKTKLLKKSGKSLIMEKSPTIASPKITSIAKPEQFPSLRYYIQRIHDPAQKKHKKVSSCILKPEKCYACKEHESCSCLAKNVQAPSVSEVKIANPHEKLESNKQSIFLEFEQKMNFPYTLNLNRQTNNSTNELNSEESLTYDCLTMHMPRLRQIYDIYTKLFSKNPPKCNQSLTKLALWQLWRDCGIQKRGLSLIEVDEYIVANESSYMKEIRYPFEKLEIWQFLHALLEVSWHLYSKNYKKNTDACPVQGRLARGFVQLLENDIYPNAGNHIGAVANTFIDLLPLFEVYQLYQRISNAPTAKDLLSNTCILADITNSKLLVQRYAFTFTIPEYFLDGSNCVTVGERMSYLPNVEKSFVQTGSIKLYKPQETALAHELLIFQQLGAVSMVNIMAGICPIIKDNESGLIINMAYKLTFLEFYEIILEAAKQLLHLRKIEEETRKAKLKSERDAILFDNSNFEDLNQSEITPRSMIQKTSKQRKNVK